MSLLEAAAGTALIALVLYIVDRGIAFNVCLYMAMAAGGRFQAEEAYNALDNPYLRWPRLVLGAVMLLAVFLLALRGSIPEREEFVIVPLLAVALGYGATSWAYAIRAFRRTAFGSSLAEAAKEGHWPDEN